MFSFDGLNKWTYIIKVPKYSTKVIMSLSWIQYKIYLSVNLTKYLSQYCLQLFFLFSDLKKTNFETISFYGCFNFCGFINLKQQQKFNSKMETLLPSYFCVFKVKSVRLLIFKLDDFKEISIMNKHE